MPERETILVADVAGEIRRMVCGMLSLRVYDCLAASSGLDALDPIERGSQPVHWMLRGWKAGRRDNEAKMAASHDHAEGMVLFGL